MRDFVRWLFREDNTKFTIKAFDGWHFLFLFITLATTIVLAVLFKNKDEEKKHKLLNVIAILCIIVYIADFFLMPLCDTYGYKISYDKLPFHICTLMCSFIPFVQFNNKFAPIKGVITMLTLTSSTMWMTYPGSALNGQSPFCYSVLQTFFFHSLIFCWAFLTISFGKHKPDIKNCWGEVIGILVIMIWATIGNTLYEGQDWFFLTGSTFPFIPKPLMPLVVLGGVFAVDIAIYSVYYLTIHIIEVVNAKQKNKEAYQN